MENKSLLPLSKSLNWARTWSDFLKYFHYSGRASSQVLGVNVPSKSLMTCNSSEGGFPTLLCELLCWMVHDESGSCSHLSQTLAWHPFSNFTALLCVNTSSPQLLLGKALHHLSEVFMMNWACLQHFPMFWWKNHHHLKEKARRGLRELCKKESLVRKLPLHKHALQ